MSHVSKIIEKRLDKTHVKSIIDNDDEHILLEEKKAFATFEFLKHDPDTNFDLLIDLTANVHDKLNETCNFTLSNYDYQSPTLEVIYLLRSTRLNLHLSASIFCTIHHSTIASISPLYDNASFFERELFDMFGIRAEGSPQHRRLLTYPGFRGYPLLKTFNADRSAITYRTNS